jgi:hypothetical protein
VEPTALRSAIRPKDTPGGMPQPSPEADLRALRLLAELEAQQAGLSRGPALAWERVFFAEAFEGPEPARRVRAFLGEGPASV